jgi:hypothetical protein
MITSWRERFIALTTGTVRTTVRRMMGSMMSKMSVLQSDHAVLLLPHPVPDCDFTRFSPKLPSQSCRLLLAIVFKTWNDPAPVLLTAVRCTGYHWYTVQGPYACLSIYRPPAHLLTCQER